MALISKNRQQAVDDGPSEKVQWVVPSATLRRRVTYMQIYGADGTGKTTLALTAPDPVAYIHFSEKKDGLLERLIAEGRDIRECNLGVEFYGTEQMISTQARPVWKRFDAAMEDAYKWARTIVVDTHTEAWEILRLWKFGTLSPRGHIGNLYAPVNAIWASTTKKRFRAQDQSNLIMVGCEGEEYRNNSPTGKMEQRGHKQMNYDGEIRVRTTKNRGTFIATIEKGWFNAPMEGSEFENEDSRFGWIMEMVTEVDEEEWSKSR